MYSLLVHFEVTPSLAAALAVGFALAPNLIVVLVRHGRGVDAAIDAVGHADALCFLPGRPRISRGAHLYCRVPLTISHGQSQDHGYPRDFHHLPRA